MRSFFVVFLFLLLLPGCSTDGSAPLTFISPDSIIGSCKDMLEDDFVDMFKLDRESFDIEETANGTMWTSKQTVKVNDHDATMIMEFWDGTFVGLRYKIEFDNEGTHLKDAYNFMYAYDMSMQEKYGDPIGDGSGRNFMNVHNTFERFEASKYMDKNGLLFWEMGDNYQIGDDFVYSVRITAWDSISWVIVRVEEYMERSLEG